MEYAARLPSHKALSRELDYKSVIFNLHSCLKSPSAFLCTGSKVQGLWFSVTRASCSRAEVLCGTSDFLSETLLSCCPVGLNTACV